MTVPVCDLTDREVELGVGIARQFLPLYLATWIEATLRESHTLPTLIEHQRKILLDLIAMREGRAHR